MILYHIHSEDSMLDQYVEEIQTDFPLEFLGIRLWRIIPKDGVFPERQIVRIVPEDGSESVSELLRQVTEGIRSRKGSKSLPKLEKSL